MIKVRRGDLAWIAAERQWRRRPRKVAYYVCRPAGKTPEGHPPGIWVPERSLVTGVHAFFAERIFGPDRAALLAEQLDGSDISAALAQREQAAGLRDRLAETSTRRKRLMRSLELADDPDGELTRDVQTRLAELRAEVDDVTAQLRGLEDSATPMPTPELLDALPVAGPDLDRLPDEQARALFDAFRLEIRYDRMSDTAHCRATLSGETLPAAVSAAGGDLATICAVPPTGFEPDGCGGAGGRLVVEAFVRWRRP